MDQCTGKRMRSGRNAVSIFACTARILSAMMGKLQEATASHQRSSAGATPVHPIPQGMPVVSGPSHPTRFGGTSTSNNEIPQAGDANDTTAVFARLRSSWRADKAA